MVKSKTNWTVNATDVDPVLPQDISPTKIVLYQQSIRMFNITYYPAKKE